VVTFHAAVPRWVAVGYRAAGHALSRAMRSSVLTAVSTTAAAPIPKRWGPVTVIPNAIDVDSYSAAVERSPTRVTFLGRDDRRKGLDVLLASWPAVRAAVPDAELVVIGTNRNTVIPGVVFVGRVDEDEKRSTLASAAIHVAPNLGGESFGIVLAEAMASGATIVASDLAAFRDVVDDAGVLVPVGDHERLGEAIARLLNDPDECARLRAAARRRVEMFDWPQVVDSYLDAYRRALDQAS
jgi:phosphatidyl-myo-inositol alpha-mannosyltransferase